MNKKLWFPKALDWVERKTIGQIKAIAEGYDDPKTFYNKTTKETLQPDISFETQNGSKHFTDIVIKNDDSQKLVTRWKLLSMMASLKRGKLHLLAPRGHKMFTRRLVDKYNVNAIVHSI
jgi:hypothetical protein